MTLIFENVKDEFLPAFKGLAKSAKVKMKKIDTPNKEFLEAIKEAKEGKTTRWDSVQAFAKAMNV
ncbi:hypothetical protein CQA38_00745 [Campylobacter sp. MIT 12-5580]|uniref:hypothetical protein n=1 Tax=Campylobacter sp. MIT 12-5580 TaxID=2040651 RepID=UPI0010F600E3|nr:hypothetical protein [Campylobacter sp. MIT 12-5580]TKX30200.1 hypothetical protein CQA38_00745 [Campylobacter sp. MIT 12-5580]